VSEESKPKRKLKPSDPNKVCGAKTPTVHASNGRA